eukprot:6201465-Pleurochrysis_carterae.AAC.1
MCTYELRSTHISQVASSADYTGQTVPSERGGARRLGQSRTPSRAQAAPRGNWRHVPLPSPTCGRRNPLILDTVVDFPQLGFVHNFEPI